MLGDDIGFHEWQATDVNATADSSSSDNKLSAWGTYDNELSAWGTYDNELSAWGTYDNKLSAWGSFF